MSKTGFDGVRIFQRADETNDSSTYLHFKVKVWASELYDVVTVKVGVPAWAYLQKQIDNQSAN